LWSILPIVPHEQLFESRRLTDQTSNPEGSNLRENVANLVGVDLEIDFVIPCDEVVDSGETGQD
jgi:hypothetical protein